MVRHGGQLRGGCGGSTKRSWDAVCQGPYIDGKGERSVLQLLFLQGQQLLLEEISPRRRSARFSLTFETQRLTDDRSLFRFSICARTNMR